MTSPTTSSPRFPSTSESFVEMPDRSKRLKDLTKSIPECGLCHTTVSDPIELKCGHIFDKCCIQTLLHCDLNYCPVDYCSLKGIKETECKERKDIYEKTKSTIKASIYYPRTYEYLEGSVVVEVDSSIFNPMEKILHKVIKQYFKVTGRFGGMFIHSVSVQGSPYKSNKTLADYEVLPGEEVSMRLDLYSDNRFLYPKADEN